MAQRFVGRGALRRAVIPGGRVPWRGEEQYKSNMESIERRTQDGLQQEDSTSLEARVVALEAEDVVLDSRLDAAEIDITTLEGVDVALDTRLDAAETFIAADKFAVTCVIDGGGAAIVAGGLAYVRVPRTGTITGWEVVADVAGSIVVDVWKDTYANFPPTVADTIAGAEKPTLVAAQKAQDLALTTWTTAVTHGDYLAFKVDSAATVTWVAVTLILDPT